DLLVSAISNPLGHFAPAAIQRRSVSTSSLERGGPFFGISGLSPETASSSRLASGSPGLTAGPLSPPASISARVCSDNSPFLSLALWQLTQRLAKMGA